MSNALGRGPTAAHWHLASVGLKQYLGEFLADPNARRPKDLNAWLIGSFRDLFELAIFYGEGTGKPWDRNAPKNVKLHDPSYGARVLVIVMKVLRYSGVPIDPDGEYVRVLRSYHRFLRGLPKLSRLKGENRQMAEKVLAFITALNAEAMEASIKRFHEQDDD